MLYEERKCAACGKEFQSSNFGGRFQLRCPSCLDIRQGRPSVVVERGIDFSMVVLVQSLPGEWVLCPPKGKKDSSYWKIERKGCEWGASWEGRIDIFCNDPIPPKIGEVALFEKLVSVHRRTDLPESPIEIRDYFKLSHCGQQPDADDVPELVWLTAYSKQTIKGFGRQFRYDIVGAPIWQWRINGGVRSGRATTEGALAIVDDDHPLKIKEIFNY